GRTAEQPGSAALAGGVVLGGDTAVSAAELAQAVGGTHFAGAQLAHVGGADTPAVHTGLAVATSDAAVAAVVGVGLGVDAGQRARTHITAIGARVAQPVAAEAPPALAVLT